jgi:hypothetical protein
MGYPYEICHNMRDDDCDGAADERDPDYLVSCYSRTDNFLGTITGDGSDVRDTVVYAYGRGSAWRWLTVAEDDQGVGGKELHATVRLTSWPLPAVEYNVRVFCMTCGGELLAETSSSSGTVTVKISAYDHWLSNDWFNLLLHVYRTDENPVCGGWSLSVTGNEGAGYGWWSVNACDRPH